MQKINKKFVASLDVDPQCGFSELCPEELPVPGALEIVGPLNDQAKYARLRIASKDAHSNGAVWIADAVHPQFTAISGYKNLDICWNAHCIIGTKGFELLPGLPKTTEYDHMIYKGIEPDKHPYGACFHDLADKESTGLIEYLNLNHITTVIVGGLATDYCVATTVKQLLRAGFFVVLNLPACRGIAIDTCNKALSDMIELSNQPWTGKLLLVDGSKGMEAFKRVSLDAVIEK